MNKILTFILLVAILLPGTSFAQKREKRKKQKQETTQNQAIAEEVTNLFIDATTAKIQGEYAKAIKLYQTCLEKNPRHSASMYELAQLNFTAGDFSTAANYAEEASQIEPANKWYKLLLAEIYKKSGNKKALLKTMQDLVKQDPGNVDYLYDLSDAYTLNDDANGALEACDKIEEILGVTEEISLQKQHIYVDQKKFDKAAAELQKLITQFPDQETRYLSIIAEMYMDAGKPELADGYYKQILAKDPNNPYIHITLSDYYRKKGDMNGTFNELKLGFANPALDIDTKIRVLLTYFSATNIYIQHKDEILDLARILVQTHPDNPKAHSMYGDFLLDNKKYTEARDEYRNVIAIDSSRYAVWEALLNTEIQLSDFTALENESTRAVELFPLFPVPYLFKGIAMLQNNKPEQALQSLTAGVKLVSVNNALLVQFYTTLGDVYNRLKNNALSDENYEKALKLDPNNSYVLNNYAYYLSLRNENLQKAETMSAKSLTLDAANPANMDTYGWILFKLGRYSEALDWVKKAVEASPKTDADLLEHLGDIYFKLGDIDNAMANWQAAQKAGSTSALIEKKIKERKLYE